MADTELEERASEALWKIKKLMAPQHEALLKDFIEWLAQKQTHIKSLKQEVRQWERLYMELAVRLASAEREKVMLMAAVCAQNNGEYRILKRTLVALDRKDEVLKKEDLETGDIIYHLYHQEAHRSER